MTRAMATTAKPDHFEGLRIVGVMNLRCSGAAILAWLFLDVASFEIHARVGPAIRFLALLRGEIGVRLAVRPHIGGMARFACAAVYVLVSRTAAGRAGARSASIDVLVSALTFHVMKMFHVPMVAQGLEG